MVIRRALSQDLPAMLQLVKELAEYERAPEQVIVDDAAMRTYWNDNAFEALVAELNERIIGTAIFYTGYSTWKGRIVYLDDIIVTESARRSGAGTQLFDSVVEHCKAIGATQLRWHVLDWNEPAIKFYNKYNAELDPEWISGKLNITNN